MKQYLICSSDEHVMHFRPLRIWAESENEALQKYFRRVYSIEKGFRVWVLDLAVNMSFVEKFYLSSDQEQNRFDSTGIAATEKELVRSRVKNFFAARPDIGERFLRYMDTGDQSLVCDEVFEYIAASDPENYDGFLVIDLDSLVEIS